MENSPSKNREEAGGLRAEGRGVFSPFSSLAFRERLGKLRPAAARGDEEEREVRELIEEVARWVANRRLEVPAVLFLEAHRPVASLAGHALIFASPLMAPLFGFKRMEGMEKLFRSEQNIERLIRRIEELAEER